jgi:hypothetical protein
MLDVLYVDAYTECWLIHKYTETEMLISLCIIYNSYVCMWLKLHVGMKKITETQQY